MVGCSFLPASEFGSVEFDVHYRTDLSSKRSVEKHLRNLEILNKVARRKAPSAQTSVCATSTGFDDLTEEQLTLTESVLKVAVF